MGVAPVAASVAPHTAVPVVMKSTLPARPPKQKFTAPGSEISPIKSPSGLKTCTPLKDDA